MKTSVTAFLLPCFILLSTGVSAQTTQSAQSDSPAPPAQQAQPSEAQEATTPAAAVTATENDSAAGPSHASLGDNAQVGTEADTAPSESAKQQAQEEAAREAFRSGDRKYLEGDYEGAVHAFEEAYSLSGRLEMLFNLANAHERLGNYAEAAVALRGYIPHAPAQNREALQRRLERLEELARAQKVAAPTPAAASAEAQPPEQARQSVSTERGIGIGLTTLGAASIVAGTAFAIASLNTRSKLNDKCVDGASGRLCPPDAEPLLNRDRVNSIVADVSLIGGTLLSATGIFLLVHSSKQQQAQVGLTPSGLQVRGTF